MNDLLNNLRGMRDGLIATMTAHLEVGGGVAVWIPLLALVQAAIETVEAAMRRTLKP